MSEVTDKLNETTKRFLKKFNFAKQMAYDLQAEFEFLKDPAGIKKAKEQLKPKKD